MTRAESVSPVRRRAVIDALRRGTVPESGLDLFAVGLERFEDALDAELATVATGHAQFKALRGEYGSGKTFFARWLAEKAKRRDMATAEIQISETETPLHKLETVYRRLVEHLATAAHQPSALRDVIEGWFYILEEDVLEARSIDDPEELARAVDALAEQRLAGVARSTPAFSAALRAYRSARLAGDDALAEGLLAWIGGQPNVSAAVKRVAGVKGDLDHFGAFGFLQGLLTVLRDSGHPGLFVVFDEIETLQRVRSDVREKSLNALRQLMDEIDKGRFPGLYLLITGTPAFFDGTQGVQRAPALAQRLAVNFADPRFDNPREVQIRLHGFDLDKLQLLGMAVRDLYAVDASERVRRDIDDEFIADLARAVTGGLGGQVGIAPRLFLRKLVGGVLDRVDQFDDFDPRLDSQLSIRSGELNEVERNAVSAGDVDLKL
ncbi:BREX system ATP-binding protein BrxD [Glycomyces salinus]|uniref:BREX system ATP-binding protein BrxD n=1 Tax=Glycomyces salinus TaxID=980294 RepID=UPI0018EB60D7|nr:BREX system ATP-binding protein BrxD [Glycomyces salinus]